MTTITPDQTDRPAYFMALPAAHCDACDARTSRRVAIHTVEPRRQHLLCTTCAPEWAVAQAKVNR